MTDTLAEHDGIAQILKFVSLQTLVNGALSASLVRTNQLHFVEQENNEDPGSIHSGKHNTQPTQTHTHTPSSVSKNSDQRETILVLKMMCSFRSERTGTCDQKKSVHRWM